MACTVGHDNHRAVAQAVSSDVFRGFDEPHDLIVRQVLAGPQVFVLNPVRSRRSLELFNFRRLAYLVDCAQEPHSSVVFLNKLFNFRGTN
ncbi:MAG: hypothetical protein USCGTAYLOR_02603 [Chromatiales bacterium USCg_Taylor]|nr:MAG: hypothetical protein USCGTAYLOR_02603 [Chromatiales bacterium USCg_Taylor]